MLLYKVDKTIYGNRKEIRDKIGIYAYKRECKNGNILFLNSNEKQNSVTIYGINSNKSK